MQRHEIIQTLINISPAKTYLEIGVQDGFTFREISASRKVAVDPNFRFDTRAETKSGVVFHEMPSDEYFSRRLGKNEKFGVIFIDGLHLFEQVLRDLLNSVQALEDDGFIIIDDVLPMNYAASLPYHQDMAHLVQVTNDPSVAWMGDVYRLIFFIRDYLPAFSFATILETHGQTVLWKAARDVPTDTMPVETISRLQYSDSVLRRDAFNMATFAEICARILR